MLLLLLLFKEWDNIKLRCFKIIECTISGQLKYHTIQTRCCKTRLHNPQPNSCPLSFLGWVHVISFSQQSSLPSPLLGQLGSLSSPLSSYLAQGACYVIQLLDLLPSSVHHSAPISVNLSQSTMLVVATCWTRKRIHFTWTFTCTFKCTFILIISASAKRCLISEWQAKAKSEKWDDYKLCILLSLQYAFNVCCMMCQCFEEEEIIMTTSTTNIFLWFLLWRSGLTKLCCFP